MQLSSLVILSFFYFLLSALPPDVKKDQTLGSADIKKRHLIVGRGATLPHPDLPPTHILNGGTYWDHASNTLPSITDKGEINGGSAYAEVNSKPALATADNQKAGTTTPDVSSSTYSENHGLITPPQTPEPESDSDTGFVSPNPNKAQAWVQLSSRYVSHQIERIPRLISSSPVQITDT